MSDGEQPWDLASASALEGAAEWIRKRSGALLVLVIRPQDAACCHAPNMQPLEATQLIRDELPRLLQFLIDQRARKKGKQDAATSFP